MNKIINDIKNNADFLVGNINRNILGPWDINFMRKFCSNINELAFNVKHTNTKLYNDLIDIKSNLFNGIGFVNIYALGRLVQIMRSYDYLSTNDFWKFIHPKIIEISKSKFEDGYYSDAVQTAIVELCSIVREYRKEKGLPEIQSDKDMLYNTFSTLKILQFTDSSTTSLKNIQEGYEKIFPGVIQAVRNPNAHKNLKMEKDDAVRKLMLASDLMYMLVKSITAVQEVSYDLPSIKK